MASSKLKESTLNLIDVVDQIQNEGLYDHNVWENESSSDQQDTISKFKEFRAATDERSLNRT